MQYTACLLLLSLQLHLLVGHAARGDTLTPVAPESVGMSSTRLAKIAEVMNQCIAEGKLTGGVVVVARRGKVVYHESFGKRDMEAGKPMEKDTIVRLFSMTRAITTASALMLVEEGKIELDAPVSKYIPVLAEVKVWTPDGLVAPRRAITVRDLMLHTAGFGGYLSTIKRVKRRSQSTSSGSKRSSERQRI